MTAPFILSYPKLLKPEPYMENGKPKGDPMYSFEGISTLDSLKEWKEVNRDTGDFIPGSVEARLVELCKSQFGDDFSVKEAVKHNGLSWPFKSGDKKADEKGEKGEHYRGKKFWRAKALAEISGNPNSPDLWAKKEDGTAERIVRGTTAGEARAASLFYGGAICSAEVNAVAGATAQGKYVTFYVNAVVFWENGERLGGSSNVERMFGVHGGESQLDPTEGMSKELDDEIPF
jgi:hypothetical protein